MRAKKIVSAVIASVMMTMSAVSGSAAGMLDGSLAMVDVKAETTGIIRGELRDGIRFEFNSETGVLTYYGSGNEEDLCDVGFNNVVSNKVVPYDNVKTIIFGEGVKSIGNPYKGDTCISYMHNLEEIRISKTVTVMYERLYYGCENLKRIIIDDENPSYDSRNNCNAVIEKNSSKLIIGCKNTTIPDGITSIESRALFRCGITSVTIPSSVTSIGTNAFSGCENLTSINVNPSNEVYYSVDNSNAIIKRDNNELVVGCINTVIPDSVTSIGGSAFNGCSGLTSITIPDSVTSIGGSAFYNCSSLTSITIPNSVTSIGGSAFSGCKGLKSIIIPEGVTSIENSTFYNCSGLTSITIPNGITKIGITAFYNCSSLTNITIPNSVTSIGSSAFSNCSGLTNITIPNSVTSIGSYAFNNCSGLTSITIPEGVTNIGSYAFGGCSGLTSIVIPKSVTDIGDNAFNGCSELISVTIANGAVKINKKAFNNCNKLKNLIISNDVTEIADSAFREWSEITSVTIPNSVTKIGSLSFYKCSGLTSLTIPDSVQTLGYSTFSGCSGLTSLTIPSGLTSLGEFAFSGCSGLTTIKVAKENRVFDSRENCNAIINRLSDVLVLGCVNTTIPSSVTGIGNTAFDSNNSITNITIPNSVKSIGSYSFRGCSELRSITIPDSVVRIGGTAFEGCTNLTIYGNAGSYAETYAKNYNIPFVDISKPNHTHSFDNGTVTKEPTSKEEGVKTHKCTVEGCTETKTEAIPKLTIAQQAEKDKTNNKFVKEENGQDYWYENGVKQGVKYNEDGTIDETYRGKEIYDEATDGWYWLDNVDGGKKAVSKDVYQDSFAGNWGDIINADGSRNGKWVRYDASGKMVKGWCQGAGADAKVIESSNLATSGQPVYYFDKVYGTMAKGYATVDGVEYFFNPITGVLDRTVTEGLAGFTGWKEVDGVPFWYEEGNRQGTSANTSYRGKEIFDPATNAWYWLDNVDGGKKAVSKDVYQESLAGQWGDVVKEDGQKYGKWVRYDAEGHMIKGWDTNEKGTYYFDPIYGTMAKGNANIDGVDHYFNPGTGIMEW